MFSMLSALEPIAHVTVATLFNSLWEAALLASIVWAILRLVPNASATTRYAAWSFALIASMLLPLATAIPQVRTQHTQAQTHAAQTHRTLTQSPNFTKQPSHAAVTTPAAPVQSAAAKPAPH